MILDYNKKFPEKDLKLKKVKLKHPLKVGDKLLPAGYIGEIVNMTDRLRKFFPKLDYKIDSTLILVKFPEMDEIILLKKQVEIIND